MTGGALPNGGPVDDRVTVVIPTLNRRELLLRTLQSVRRQEDVDLRVIVVNDGGRDGSGDAVDALGDPRVQVLNHETPKGVSAARNAGLRSVTTPWVAFVDDDDLFAPRKLRAQLDALAANSAARWSCVSSVVLDHEMNVLRRVAAPTDSDLGHRLLARNEIPGGGSGVVLRTELAHEVGGYDESISNLADWDFYIRLGLARQIAPASQALLAYYIHPGGMSLDVRRSAEEYDYLADKYAAQRTERGVELQRFDWTLYLATVAFHNRDRRWGAQQYMQVFHLRPSLGVLVLILREMTPRRLREVGRQMIRGTKPTYGAEDLDWLSIYRT